MRHVPIVHLIEHVSRELDVACAVRCLLQNQYGLESVVVSLVGDLTSTFARYRPQVVVLPYGIAAKYVGASILATWPEARYVNLACEQIYHNANKYFKRPRDEFARRYVLHTAWGDFFRDFLLEHGVSEANIRITGNPSYALYRSPYASYYATREELAERYHLNPGKRWIFVPENYSIGFYPDELIHALIRNGFNEQDAYAYRNFARTCFQMTAPWWFEAAERSSVEIVVRPRPATPATTFLDECHKLNSEFPQNIHFIKEGTVREWVLAADLVVSNYSTTLVEAAIANKPIALLAPVPYPDFLHVDVFDHIPRIRSLEEFLQLIAAPSIPATHTRLKNWAAVTVLRQTAPPTQQDPLRNLVDLLAEVVHGGIPALTAPHTAVEYPDWTKGWAQPSTGIAGWARRCLGTARRWLSRPAQRYNPHDADTFNELDVQQRTRRWSSLLGRDNLPPCQQRRSA